MTKTIKSYIPTFFMWLMYVTAITLTGTIVSSAYFNKLKSEQNARENEKLWSALARQEDKLVNMGRKIDLLRRKRAVRSTVTGYSSEVRQTDSTPYTTAFMKDVRKVKPGLVAVSWKLLEDDWTPGRCIWIDRVGVRKIDDSMARGTEGLGIDIWFHSRADALKFGRKRNVLVLLLEECGESM